MVIHRHSPDGDLIYQKILEDGSNERYSTTERPYGLYIDDSGKINVSGYTSEPPVDEAWNDPNTFLIQFSSELSNPEN